MSDLLKTVQNQVEQMHGPNDVLIGYTTICEAARLISNTESDYSEGNASTLNILRILELCALVEAVVLHDTLFTLPATLPDDVENLLLRKRLSEMGILKEYSSPMLLKDTVSTLTNWITINAKEKAQDIRHSGYGSFDVERVTQLLTNNLTKMIDKSGINSSPDSTDSFVNDINSGRDNYFHTVTFLIERLNESSLLGKESVLKEVGAEIGIDMSYMSSGRYEFSLNILRNFVYWQAADRAHLPWYPDVLRVPFMATLNQRLKFSLTDQVYGVVAQAFSTTVDELFNEDLPYEAVIPPLSALLLSRCSKREDVIEKLLALRDEFTDFRRTFRDLEQQRRDAKSIKELRNARTKTMSLLRAVASKYRDQDQSIFETTLGYAPDVINVLANPLDPSRYKIELLKKSYEWIRDWWCRRPASRLFSVTRKLETLKLYGQLIPNVFGFEITVNDVAFIREYNAVMQLLLTSSESKKPKTS